MVTNVFSGSPAESKHYHYGYLVNEPLSLLQRLQLVAIFQRLLRMLEVQSLQLR